jgi:pyruvate/2-oxoglutarate dehydrogenase complex dihydrolipoamide dehydrogenase (E3) component
MLQRQMSAINAGIERDGPLYLFTLRLVPVIPFFAINLAMGLTTLRAWTFYWVSQIGMLTGTIVYVNAGAQVARIQATRELLSLNVIAAFLLLAAFPWIARGIARLVRRRNVYRGWRRPKRYDRNLIVIGAGSAGLVTAYIGAAVKASVTLVERDRMGGDCLNTGCVPSKALIKSANVLHQTRHLVEYGIDPVQAEPDFAAVMARIRRIIEKIEPHDSVERYRSLGVDARIGHARLVSPWEVEIEHEGHAQRLTARSIVIATGARPVVPPIPGLDELDAADCLTSETVWGLRARPARLLVLGGGPVGCELSQAFARLGSAVVHVEMLDRLMSRDDAEAAALVAASLRSDGVDLRLSTRADRFAREDGVNVVYVRSDTGESRIEFDKVLVALGRRANTEGLGLEALGIETRGDGTVATNEFLQTHFPNIYACGDVAGPFQFTHTASHQAWYAAVNGLFGVLRKFKADYRVIPWTTFTDPEVAHVGLTEAQARENDIDCEITRYDLADLDRAIADGNDRGFVKVITRTGSDQLLGATIVGADAGNLIAEYVLAMKQKIGLNQLLGTIHVYPTLAEANKFAAGEWKKAHAPARVLEWVAWFHGVMRGSEPDPRADAAQDARS